MGKSSPGGGTRALTYDFQRIGGGGGGGVFRAVVKSPSITYEDIWSNTSLRYITQEYLHLLKTLGDSEPDSCPSLKPILK